MRACVQAASQMSTALCISQPQCGPQGPKLSQKVEVQIHAPTVPTELPSRGCHHHPDSYSSKSKRRRPRTGAPQAELAEAAQQAPDRHAHALLRSLKPRAAWVRALQNPSQSQFWMFLQGHKCQACWSANIIQSNEDRCIWHA